MSIDKARQALVDIALAKSTVGRIRNIVRAGIEEMSILISALEQDCSVNDLRGLNRLKAFLSDALGDLDKLNAIQQRMFSTEDQLEYLKRMIADGAVDMVQVNSWAAGIELELRREVSRAQSIERFSGYGR